MNRTAFSLSFEEQADQWCSVYLLFSYTAAMRLTILGKNADDRGTQLEQLTVQLLESLGYTRLTTNVVGNAGEVDVVGEFVVNAPVSPHVTRMIGECKAYSSPMNMPDWLKFLGKFFAEEMKGESLLGCFVALSGVNGYVHDSYATLQKRCSRIRLVDSTTLVEYLSKSHRLADPQQMKQKLSAYLRYTSLELAYYDRRVYWLVIFDAGQYTLLAADGSFIEAKVADELKPLVEQALEVTTFVDLHEEAVVRQARLLTKKMILAVLMLGNGTGSEKAVQERIETAAVPGYTTGILTEVCTELETVGLVVRGADGSISFSEAVNTDIVMRYRMITEFITEVAIILPLGCDWWDKNIDLDLIEHVCKVVQFGLELTKNEKKKAVKIMRLSPGALQYALMPDQMITLHRKEAKVLERVMHSRPNLPVEPA